MNRAVLLLAPLLLAGCAVTKGAEAPKTLRLAPVFAPSPSVAPGALSIAPVQAGGVAAERRYAYVDPAAPKEIRQAQSLFWDEPPPRLVERALVAGLRSRFAAVTGPEASVNADRRILARLDRFEEESGASARAMVAIDVTVVRASDRQVVLAGRYCGATAIEGADASARATAFEGATAQVVLRLGADLVSGRRSDGGC